MTTKRADRNQVSTARRMSTGEEDDDDDKGKCATSSTESAVGAVRDDQVLALRKTARFESVARRGAPAGRCRSTFAELPRDVLTLVYSFGNVCEHFRLARCARSLKSVAYMPASSPAAIVVRPIARDSDGSLPGSLSMLRPASLRVHRECVANMPQLCAMQSVRALDLVSNWYDPLLTAEPNEVWTSLRRFRKLTSLGLMVRRSSEAVAPLGAVGVQLETLHIDMCVVHVDFDFSCLAQCTHLVELRLTDVELADTLGLKRLAACTPRLARLALKWEYESSERSSVDLRFLDAFTQLRRLDVSSSDRCVALPDAMPFLEYAAFETKWLVPPSSFRGWSSLRSLRLPRYPLSDRQLPATLTHLDASALTAPGADAIIIELVAAPLQSLRRLVFNRRATDSPSAERPDGGVTVLQQHISSSGSSLEIEWVDSESRSAAASAS